MIENLYKRIQDVNPTIEGWCETTKAGRMAKAICDVRSDISVELGVFGGRGLIAMAMAHQHLNHGVCWGFDPWTKGAAIEGFNDEANNDWWSKIDLEAIYKHFVGKVVSNNLLKECYWARLRSDQAIKLFRDESVDVIHQDSNHCEEVSCAEVLAWKSKIKIGGYWFADDTDWPSLKKAIKLLQDNGFALVEDHKKWMLFQKTERK